MKANYDFHKCEILCQTNQTMEDKCKKFVNKFRVDISQLNFSQIKILKNFINYLNRKIFPSKIEMICRIISPKLNNISLENGSSNTQCLNTETNPLKCQRTQVNDISQEKINKNNENTQIVLFNLNDEEAKKSFRYKKKDCLCSKHCDERYIYYCKNCGINLCSFCESEHMFHELVKFNQFITKDDENILKNKFKENEVLKNNFIDKIESYIKFLNKIVDKVKLDYEIKKEFVNNYKFIYRNFKVIELLNKAKQNYSFFDDINNIMENKNIIFNKIENLINIINTNKFGKLNCNSNDNIKNDDMNSNNDIVKELINPDHKKFSESLQNIINVYQNSFKNKINNEAHELINNPYPINVDQKEILLEYKIDGEKIKLFSEEFVNKNKGCFIEYNNQNIELKSELKLESLENNSDKLEIKIKELDNIKSINGMFSECGSLLSVKGLENININGLTDMSGIFYKCKSLTHLSDISKWDTSNITNMSNIFYECSSLETIPDISNWNTCKLNKMDKMFYGCSSLKTLPDISKWNTSNVNDISYLFFNCTSLECLPDISIWNISNVKSLNCVFKGCCSLKT